MSDIPNNLIDN